MTKDDVAAATSPPPAEQTGGGQIPDQADQGTQQRRAYDAQSRPAQTQTFKGGTSRGRGSPKSQPARKAAGSTKKSKQERKAERAAAGQRSPQQHALEDRTDARAEPGPSPPQVGRVSDDPSADQVDKSDLKAAAQVTPPTHPPSYIPYSTPHQAAV